MQILKAKFKKSNSDIGDDSKYKNEVYGYGSNQRVQKRPMGSNKNHGSTGAPSASHQLSTSLSTPSPPLPSLLITAYAQTPIHHSKSMSTSHLLNKSIGHFSLPTR